MSDTKEKDKSGSGSESEEVQEVDIKNMKKAQDKKRARSPDKKKTKQTKKEEDKEDESSAEEEESEEEESEEEQSESDNESSEEEEEEEEDTKEKKGKASVKKRAKQTKKKTEIVHKKCLTCGATTKPACMEPDPSGEIVMWDCMCRGCGKCEFSGCVNCMVVKWQHDRENPQYMFINRIECKSCAEEHHIKCAEPYCSEEICVTDEENRCSRCQQRFCVEYKGLEFCAFMDANEKDDDDDDPQCSHLVCRKCAPHCAIHQPDEAEKPQQIQGIKGI